MQEAHNLVLHSSQQRFRGPKASPVALRVSHRQRQGQRARDDVSNERNSKARRVGDEVRLVVQQRAQFYGVPQRERRLVHAANLAVVLDEGELDGT